MRMNLPLTMFSSARNDDAGAAYRYLRMYLDIIPDLAMVGFLSHFARNVVFLTLRKF